MKNRLFRLCSQIGAFFILLMVISPLISARISYAAEDKAIMLGFYCSGNENECIEQDSEEETVLIKNIEQLPSPTPSNSNERPTSLDEKRIFELVNEYRKKIGLEPFNFDETLYKIAQSRAPEIAGELYGRRLHAGFFKRDLPFLATENLIYVGSEEGAVNWWLHSPTHRKSIQGDYKYSAVACWGVGCTQIFTNYIPK